MKDTIHIIIYSETNNDLINVIPKKKKRNSNLFKAGTFKNAKTRAFNKKPNL